VSPVLKDRVILALKRGFEESGILQGPVVELVDIFDVVGFGFFGREVEGDSSEVGERTDRRQGRF
jgi:hypothetical protein